MELFFGRAAFCFERLGRRLDVGGFEAVVLLLVKSFEVDGKEKGKNAEAGEDNHRNGVVVVDKESFGGFLAELDRKSVV